MKVCLSMQCFMLIIVLMFYIKNISSKTQICFKKNEFNPMKNTTSVHKARNIDTELRNAAGSRNLFKSMFLKNSKNRKKRGNPLNMICSKRSSCEYNDKVDVPNCYCDKQCEKFKDCCYGYRRSNISNVTSDILLYQDYMECRLDIIPGSTSSFRGYWMVTKCPDMYKIDKVSAKCRDTTKDDIPVTDNWGIVYGNVYCAHCHGVTDYIPWTVKLKVDNRSCYKHFPADPLLEKNLLSSSYIGQLRNKTCTFTYLPPERNRPRTCYTSLSVSKSKEQSETCQNHLNPVIIDYKIKYRNIYCVETWMTEDCIDDGFPYHERSLLYPLTILFSVRQPKLDNENLCSSDHQFDDRTGMCFPEECKEVGNNCEAITGGVSIRNYIHYINLILVSDNIIDTNVSRRALSMFTTCLPIQKYDLLYRQKSGLDKIFLYNTLTTNIGDVKSVINATFAYVVRKTLDKGTLLNFKTRLENMEFGYTRKFSLLSKAESITIWRVWNVSGINLNIRFTQLHWGGLTMTNKYLNDLENGDDLPILDHIPNKCKIDIIDVNRSINGEVTFIANLNYTTNTINISKHSFKNNRYSDDNIHDDQLAKGLLTYITLSISCGAAVPTVLIHRFLRLVKSTPGVITEQILIVLFLFSISFMSGIVAKVNNALCFVIAVFAHYLLICFFTWISIFVCHTLKQLQNLKKANNNTHFKNRPFPRIYFVLGYLVPFLITIPPAVNDLCGCTNINIGYTSSACFPTGYPANLIIVVIPVLLFLLIHFLCLSYSGWRLYKVSNDLPSFGINTSRSYVSVYIRLCLFSGLSWGLGVLSEALDSDPIRYIFILLSGLHGLIFTLCIVSTKTFRQSFRDKMLTSQTPEQIDMNIDLNDESESRTQTNDSAHV